MRNIKSDYLLEEKEGHYAPITERQKHILDPMQASYHKVTLSVYCRIRGSAAC